MAQAELVVQAVFLLSVLGTLALLVTLEFDFQPHVPVPALVNLCWLRSSAFALW
jgi:hypothetical protein